jgi:hypothetical protein
MRTRTAVLFFCLLFVLTGTALATDGEWADAVDAAEAVDPTLDAPALTGTDVSVVGGGKANAGGSFPNFAFSASERSGVASGQMTVIGGFGNNVTADVVCIAAAVSPDGRGGTARLVGRLSEPQSGNPTLVFDVTDSGLAGGDGDTWASAIFATPPEEFPCIAPAPGPDPIANGNIAIRSLD